MYKITGYSLGDDETNPAALHGMPTETADSSHVFNDGNLQNNQR